LVNWADYTGFLCSPEDEPGVIGALVRHLCTMPWAQLEMKNLLFSDRRLALFLGAFPLQDFEIRQRPRGPNRDGIDNDACPWVQLPASFEGFLAERVSPNTRQKLRRFLRAVEGGAGWRVTESDDSTYVRDIELLLGFWRQAWAAHKGEDIERLTRYYRSILRNAFEAGLMYMPVLWRGDRAVGVLGHFVDNRTRTMLFKVAGRDPACMGEVLEHCLRYQQKGQPEKAETGYLQVLQQEPSHPVATFLLDVLHRQRRMNGSEGGD